MACRPPSPTCRTVQPIILVIRVYIFRIHLTYLGNREAFHVANFFPSTQLAESCLFIHVSHRGRPILSFYLRVSAAIFLLNLEGDLKIFQLEKKLEKQLSANDGGDQSQQTSSLRPDAPPYFLLKQYGNHQWPPRPSQRPPAPSAIRGCYYDGRNDYRENCEELKKALENSRKGQSQTLFLGREDSGSTVRVPFPEEKDRRIVWQKEWVENELRKKESEVNVIRLEKLRERSMRREDKKEEEDQIEYMNGQPVVVTRVEIEDDEEVEVVVEEKRLRDDEDKGQSKKKFAVEIPTPEKVLGRGESLEKRGEYMEVDTDEDIGASGSKKKEKGKGKEVGKSPIFIIVQLDSISILLFKMPKQSRKK